MYSQKMIMKSMQDYSERVNRAKHVLAEADFVLIGAGAGLSAAAGLNYQDPNIFEEWYPQFRKLGFHTIWEAITTYWKPNDANRRRFWAFWAHHIQKIRYDAPPGQPYLGLRELLADKEHFVITTNVDGQFVKSEFDRNLIFTPQGDYGLFQCATPCRKVLYENQDMLHQMLANLNEKSLLIREEDIPRCPHCGEFLERNLRIDGRFVEELHMQKKDDYLNFVDASASGKLALIELGVGFNTPGIIRWPFEQIALRHHSATLIRMNMENVEVPQEIESKSIQFKENLAPVVRDLK